MIGIAGSLTADVGVVHQHGIDAVFSVLTPICTLEDALGKMRTPRESRDGGRKEYRGGAESGAGILTVIAEGVAASAFVTRLTLDGGFQALSGKRSYRVLPQLPNTFRAFPRHVIHFYPAAQ